MAEMRSVTRPTDSRDSGHGFEVSRQRIAESAQHLAGGVGSNFRMGISPTPLVFERAEGPILIDADGNRLIDYYLGMGPMLLGHTPADVCRAVERQLGRGILYGGQSAIEARAAELVCGMVPCAERVRFNSCGSEAVQAALRLARAVTGREQLVKFAGHYHGWFDNVLWSTARAGRERAGDRQPRSAGRTAERSGAAVERPAGGARPAATARRCRHHHGAGHVQRGVHRAAARVSGGSTRGL